MTSDRLPSTDAHTHVGVDTAFYLAGWLPYASSAQDLLEHMDQAGIDRAVCFPNPTPAAFDPWAFADRRALVQLPGRVPYAQENSLLVTELQRVDTARRLMPFAMFDPGRDVHQQVEDLYGLTADLKGLKSQPTLLQSPVRLLLKESRTLMDFATEFDLPVVLHTAVDPRDSWSQAMDCLEVAARYPKVRFSLAHSLRFDAHALGTARTLNNVWVDCSAHLLHCQLAVDDAPAIARNAQRLDVDYTSPADVLCAVHDVLGGAYLWGSDSPYQSWSDDDFCSVYRYTDEADVLRKLPGPVRESMLREAPHAWLTGRTS